MLPCFYIWDIILNVKVAERPCAAPRQVRALPPPTAFSADRTAAPKGQRSSVARH